MPLIDADIRSATRRPIHAPAPHAMTPRMEKLQRQRALLQDHLRWLESEIAAEASVPAITPRDPPAPLVEMPATASLPDAPPAAHGAEVPEPNVRGIHSEVRSGCLLYFGLAFAAVGLLVAYIYWKY